MEKKFRIIEKLYKAPVIINNGDMLLRRAIPTNNIESIGPFVFLDDFNHKSKKSIGDSAHPHAGIEVISYLLEGESEHFDSMGNNDLLFSGESQYIKSGSGLLHKEIPHTGRHGLQLWTSLPAKNKFDTPSYGIYKKDSIPVIDNNGNTIKLLAGSVNGIEGPIPMVSPTLLLYAQLNNTNELTIEVDEFFQLGVYVTKGSVSIGNHPSVLIGDVALLSQGNLITLKTYDDSTPTEIVILGGQKITEPLFFDGPFVMDSPENIKLAYRNYISGKMGTMDGIPY